MTPCIQVPLSAASLVRRFASSLPTRFRQLMSAMIFPTGAMEDSTVVTDGSNMPSGTFGNWLQV
jgi:hypothetical protein